MKARRYLFSFWFLFTLIGLSLVNWEPSFAQTPLTLRTLEVDLWPEYDRPSVLVIYHITLPSDLKLPQDLTLRIPSTAGEPNAVAVREADGSLLKIAYNRKVNGDWSEITFSATMPQIQLEYYDPSLNKSGGARNYVYQWPGDYAINQLIIQVQQPIGANALSITPSMSKSTMGNDGLTYYSTEAGELDAGQSFQVRLSYQKPDDSLSAESLQVQPSVPIGKVTTTRRTLMNYLPFILGGLGLILIIGAGFWWYWQTGVGKGQVENPHRRRRLVIAPEEVIPQGNVYCPHCGKRALPGDRFCRTCGTKLRG